MCISFVFWCFENVYWFCSLMFCNVGGAVWDSGDHKYVQFPDMCLSRKSFQAQTITNTYKVHNMRSDTDFVDWHFLRLRANKFPRRVCLDKCDCVLLFYAIKLTHNTTTPQQDRKTTTTKTTNTNTQRIA